MEGKTQVREKLGDTQVSQLEKIQHVLLWKERLPEDWGGDINCPKACPGLSHGSAEPRALSEIGSGLLALPYQIPTLGFIPFYPILTFVPVSIVQPWAAGH